MLKQATTTSTSTLRVQRRQAWMSRMERFKARRQTVVAFCRTESVSVPTFYHWRARLRQMPAKPIKVQPVHAAPSFIDLGTLVPAELAQPAMAESLSIRLDLGSGQVLSIERR